MPGTKTERLETLQPQKKKRRLSEEELSQKVLYFAYGSNVLMERLVDRVGDVTMVGIHELTGFDLVFDCGSNICRYANLIPDPKKSVQGIIYEMEYRQLRRLDYFEALYVREKGMYGERKLHYYISDRRDDRPGKLAMQYWGAIKAGCVKNKLGKLGGIIDKILLDGAVSIHSF